MIKLPRGPAAAIALCCLLTSPAAADSIPFTLASTWQRIASSGQTVDVQNTAGSGVAVLSTTTSASGAPAGFAGQALLPGEHRCYVLTVDLYARTGTSGAVVVTPGVCGGGSGSPTSVQPGPVTIAQTTLTLAAGTSTQLIGANAARKSLRWMVTGMNPVTVVPGTTAAVANAGMNYSGAAGAGQQGGSEGYDAGAVPTNAFQAISAAGTTLTIWEGQ